MSRMTAKDIAWNYIHASNKSEQIYILADLTLLDSESIVEILKGEGVFHKEDVRMRTCMRCGEDYVARYGTGRAVCPACTKKKREARDWEKRRSG